MRISYRRSIACMVFVVAVSATACLSTTQRREDTLQREVMTFNDDWRWARWESMAQAMPREDAAAFLERVAALDGELQIVDYDVSSITFSNDSKQANVVSRFDWIYQRDQRVRRTTVNQLWEQRDGLWRVVRLRRTRGDRFGLVTEPVAAPAGAGTEATAPASGAPAPAR